MAVGCRFMGRPDDDDMSLIDRAAPAGGGGAAPSLMLMDNIAHAIRYIDKDDTLTRSYYTGSC